MKRAVILIALVACGGNKSTPLKQGPGGGGGGLPPPPDGGRCQAGDDPTGTGSCEPGGAEPPPPPPDRPDKLFVESEIEVVGAIPKDAIHRVVRENWTAIRYCYETLLMQQPALEGRVVAKFKVGLDGTVSDATATGVHPQLETCVADKIRKFRFPKPDGAASVEVSYPLTFKPG